MSRSHEVIKVMTNGHFVLSDALLVDYRQQKLAELLNELAGLQNHLESLVRRALMDDERLLGQEKANIVNVLHMIVRDLVSLHLRLVDSEQADKFPKHPQVSESQDGYTVEGKMSPEEVNVKFSLKEWVNTYLEKHLEQLIQDFQAAAKDHQFTLEERVKLVIGINDLLLQSIQAFYLMRTGAVFT